VKVLSPYLMHLTLQLGPFFVHLVSGHAPVETAPETEKAAFWETVYDELQRVCSNPLHVTVAGIDANARVGSVKSPAVGGSHPAKENKNGHWLRAVAAECSLVLANTFHYAGDTWADSSGHSFRIDYVLSSSKLLSSVSECRVVREIDLATKCRDDHRPLLAAFSGILNAFAAASDCPQVKDHVLNPLPGHRPQYTLESLSDPARLCLYQKLVAESYDPPADGEKRAETCRQVDVAIENMVKKIHDAAKSSFIRKPKPPLKKWLIERTWTVIRWTNQL